jgi:hypothetical protein
VWRITAILASLLLAGCGGESRPTTCEPVDRGVLPEWARAGFSDLQPKAPHVIGRDGTIAAVLFGDPLSSPPDANRNNKILWVARRTPPLGDLKIIASQGSRTVTRVVARGPGPSIIDLPAAGCWQLTLRWAGQTDTMGLAYR